MIAKLVGWVNPNKRKCPDCGHNAEFHYFGICGNIECNKWLYYTHAACPHFGKQVKW